MKKPFLFSVLFLTQHLLLLSKNPELPVEKSYWKSGQDSTARLHLGIVPYVLFSKSTGLYSAFTYKNLAAEYRITYTIPTTIVFLWPHDWNYYQGINNSLTLSYRISDQWQVGLVTGLRYWWYSNQWILSDNTYASSGYAYNVKRNAYMYGNTLGLEGQRDFSFKHADLALFFGCTYSTYTGAITFLDNNLNYGKQAYPYTQARNIHWFNLAFGIKFGYRTGSYSGI